MSPKWIVKVEANQNNEIVFSVYSNSWSADGTTIIESKISEHPDLSSALKELVSLSGEMLVIAGAGVL